jgi:ribosome production factor 2
MVFTSISDTKIECRHYEINVGKQINETDVKKQTLAMNEIGPRFNLTYRRDKIADSDLYKQACRQPKLMKAETKQMKKNMYTDEFGQQRGKVFLQHQDTQTLVTRKFTKVKGKKPNKNTPVP